MPARMASADDCFARFERGAIRELGSSVRKRVRGPSWGQGEVARPASHQYARLVRARQRRPPLRPLLHCVLLMIPTFPEGSEVRIGPAWEWRPVMVHHPRGRMCAAEGLYHGAACMAPWNGAEVADAQKLGSPGPP